MNIRKILTALIALAGAQGPTSAAATPVELDARVKSLVAKVKSTLVHMPGGSFDMGDWGREEIGGYYDLGDDSRPLHKVRLDGFSIMAYKVTFEDFDVFTDATGKERINMDPYYLHQRAPKRSAGVSWYGAQAYCHWLGRLTNLSFDLPTEAQWEYAARSGGKRVIFGTDNGKIERPRNFPQEWKHGEVEPPLPDVGAFPPNPAGIYGMTENTYEWVLDWFDPAYYKVSPEANPTGPATGVKKVQRGSVGGKAEISAAVFMRNYAEPQRMETIFPDYAAGKENLPYPGYSSFESDNFRCVATSKASKSSN